MEDTNFFGVLESVEDERAMEEAPDGNKPPKPKEKVRFEITKDDKVFVKENEKIAKFMLKYNSTVGAMSSVFGRKLGRVVYETFKENGGKKPSTPRVRRCERDETEPRLSFTESAKEVTFFTGYKVANVAPSTRRLSNLYKQGKYIDTFMKQYAKQYTETGFRIDAKEHLDYFMEQVNRIFYNRQKYDRVGTIIGFLYNLFEDNPDLALREAFSKPEVDMEFLEEMADEFFDTMSSYEAYAESLNSTELTNLRFLRKAARRAFAPDKLRRMQTNQMEGLSDEEISILTKNFRTIYGEPMEELVEYILTDKESQKLIKDLDSFNWETQVPQFFYKKFGAGNSPVFDGTPEDTIRIMEIVSDLVSPFYRRLSFKKFFGYILTLSVDEYDAFDSATSKLMELSSTKLFRELHNTLVETATRKFLLKVSLNSELGMSYDNLFSYEDYDEYRPNLQKYVEYVRALEKESP